MPEVLARFEAPVFKALQEMRVPCAEVSRQPLMQGLLPFARKLCEEC